MHVLSAKITHILYYIFVIESCEHITSTIRLICRKLSFGYGVPGIEIIKEYHVVFNDVFVILANFCLFNYL